MQFAPKAVYYANYQQRVMAELERLSQDVKPGCLGLMLSDSQDVRRVRETLAHSNIAVLLAAGPQQACQIYDYVPSPWRELYLGARPRSIEEVTRLVALNLDWYLKPPARLIRAEWIWLGLAALILLASTVSLLFALAGQLPLTGGSILLPVLVAIVIWTLLQGDPRRAGWIKLLRAHLGDTYSD